MKNPVSKMVNIPNKKDFRYKCVPREDLEVFITFTDLEIVYMEDLSDIRRGLLQLSRWRKENLIKIVSMEDVSCHSLQGAVPALLYDEKSEKESFYLNLTAQKENNKRIINKRNVCGRVYR